jgi:hypothetical protein
MLGRKTLLRTNAVALVVHAAFLVWSLSAESKPSHEVQLVRVRANWTEASLNGFVFALTDASSISYKALSGISFGAAVVSHALAVMLLWKESAAKGSVAWTYRDWLQSGFHPQRWLEYGLSASAQSVTLALGVGVRTPYLLLTIFALHAVTMYGGYVCELHARPRRRQLAQKEDEEEEEEESACHCLCATSWVGRQSWLSWFHYDGRLEWDSPFPTRLAPFWGGVLSIGVAWSVLIACFAQSVADTRELRGPDAPSIPPWVVAALFGTMVLFFSFAVNAFLFLWARPSVSRFIACEAIYVVLSLTAKVWLGSLVLANVLMG